MLRQIIGTAVLFILYAARFCHAVKEICTEDQLCEDSSGHEGYCWNQVCMTQLPEYERLNLTFQIVVQYPEKTIENSSLYIRGNGLGFNWQNGFPLTKTSFDTWKIDVVYTSGKYGYVCQDCQDRSTLKPGQNFQYRILVGDRIDMHGGDFLVTLPVSKSALVDTTRQFHVQPWFFQKTGTTTNFTVDSNFIRSDRKLSFYAPPSFLENPYKKYGVLMITDVSQSRMEFLKGATFDELVTSGLVEETLIVGWGDYDSTERRFLLTPSVGTAFQCLNGTFANQCNGCYPPECGVNSPEWLVVMRDRCGYPVDAGGNGEATLNFLTKEVLPKVDELSLNRTLKDRQKTGMLGFSLGGLLACHALWTRPDVLGYAACQSSAFWWPILPDASCGFEFFNVTLKNPEYQRDRMPQRVYIDLGDEYGLPYFGPSPDEAADLLASTGYFRLDENLFFQLHGSLTHLTMNWLQRMWSPLSLLIPPAAPPTPIPGSN